MRRAADVSTLTCPLTAREREAVDEIKAALGIRSDADFVRTAAYGLGAQCEADIDTGLFRLRDYEHRTGQAAGTYAQRVHRLKKRARDREHQQTHRARERAKGATS